MASRDVKLTAADRRLLDRIGTSARRVAALEKERAALGDLLEEAHERSIPSAVVADVSGLTQSALRVMRHRRRA